MKDEKRLCPNCGGRITAEGEEPNNFKYCSPACYEQAEPSPMKDVKQVLFKKVFTDKVEEHSPGVDFNNSIIVLPTDDPNEFILAEPTDDPIAYQVTIATLNPHTVWENPTDHIGCGLLQGIKNYQKLRHEIIGDDSYNEHLDLEENYDDAYKTFLREFYNHLISNDIDPNAHTRIQALDLKGIYETEALSGIEVAEQFII